MEAFKPNDGTDGPDDDENKEAAAKKTQTEEAAPFLPTSRMFTRNLLLVMLVSVIQDTHISTAAMAMPNFLSDPVASAEERRSWVLPFLFGGGCGFGPRAVSHWVVVFGE